MKSPEEDPYGFTPNTSLSQYHSLQSSPHMSVAVTEPPASDSQDERRATGFYPALEGPRIEITAYCQFPEDEGTESHPPITERVNSSMTLPLPCADGYRDPSCLSPASSVSSRSVLSDASYESGFSYNYDNSPQNSPWQSPSVSPKADTLALPGEGRASHGSPRGSPAASPRISITEDTWLGPRSSRPSSPCGAKRKYSLNSSNVSHKSFLYSPTHSPGLSPHASPRPSVMDESWLLNTNQYTNSAILAAINALTTDGAPDLGEGIPIKARKTGLERSAALSLKVEPGGAELQDEDARQDEISANRTALKKESYGGGFLDIPQHPYAWTKSKQYLSPSLPALDWQLPSISGAYSLEIIVQPKSHHRAHYETEGSRGAVKALAGGHPVVQLQGYLENEPLTLQLFIGTADDRLLRPHAFYQVHRITGKTVSTASRESLHNNTKVLEIPLLPENNMQAIVDCAGILKLRNSDIELRKGETDIGRKNTRVRMVFRVHISQPDGRTVSLQASSNPIECSQRSAQELPLVDKQSLETSPAGGGQTMILDGHNFQQDCRVVFVEKAQDGHHIWETEAKVERDPLKPNLLLVEIPPYRNQRLSMPVHVNFYVCNGKRKRSQYQRLAYVPASVPTIKTEPRDDYDAALVCSQHGAGRRPHPKPFYLPQVVTPMKSDLGPTAVGGAYAVGQQILVVKPSPVTGSCSPGPAPKRHDLSPPPFSKCLHSTRPPSPVPHVSIIQETPALLQPPHLFPRRGLSSPVNSQSSTPTDVPGGGPGGSELHKPAERDQSPQQAEGRPPGAVSVKEEPQELDQMYLDDVNEIIQNDLSRVSVHSHT